MTTIFVGQSANLAVTIQNDGVPVVIPSAATVKARLFSLGGDPLSDEKTCTASDTGANWPAGVLSVAFSDTETGNLEAGDCMLVVAAVDAPFIVKRIKVSVQRMDEPVKSSLFIKDFIVAEIREDKLLAAAQKFAGGAAVTDDYIWRKVRAAEAEIAHTLRVPLVPTVFFPGTPTAEQIAALDGKPWAEDPGYDYHQQMFFPDEWGMIKLRNKPLIEVQAVDIDFPSLQDSSFVMPSDWIRPDKKYGQIQFVPTTPLLFSLGGTFILQAMTGYNRVPFMLKIRYVAGLEDAHRDYPDLIDAIKKMAVLKAIGDKFPAQSGSISADGLSQSISVDMQKYHDDIELILNGPKGTNGGLMAAIHGIRVAVI